MKWISLSLLWTVIASTVAQEPSSPSEHPGDDHASSSGHMATESAAEGKNGERNLMLALAQIAGVHVCDEMRGRFRTLSAGSRDGEPASSGTLWIESCSAEVDGTHLSVALGGRGWRWVYRVEERVGAQFEVGQYAAFAMDMSAEGHIDADYDPDQQVFTFRFKPAGEPTVDFRPLGNVDVDTEGLWSTVVGGAASLLMRSPNNLARKQMRSTGRESFKEVFAQGYVAELDFCTGRLEAGFGEAKDVADNANDKEQSSSDQITEEATPGYMQPDGLIMDGPHDIDPEEFSVEIDSDGPLRTEVMCHNSAEQLARAHLDGRELPDVKSLSSATIHGRQTLDSGQERVTCPVVVVLRGVPGSVKSTFGFRYRIATPPFMEPTQECKRGQR